MALVKKMKPFYGIECFFVPDEERFELCTSCVACTRNGEIFVFEEYFDMPKEFRRFILYHELGHIAGNKSEEAANAYAVRFFPGDGKAALKTLQELTPAVREATVQRLKKKGLWKFEGKEKENGTNTKTDAPEQQSAESGAFCIAGWQ